MESSAIDVAAGGRNGGTVPAVARATDRLTDLGIRKLKDNGKYVDGRGLYLQVTNGAKSWIHRYALEGAERYMGLGPYPLVSLSDARAARDENLRLIARGIDPIPARVATRVAAKITAAQSTTFRQVAEAYIEAHQPGWKNKKHGKQWGATLEQYAYPRLGALPIVAIGLSDVLACLKPMWTEVPETASRVRQRIEAILNSAAAQGMRSSDNPARWKGHLDKLLPNRAKVRAVRHQPAMPYRDVPGFVDVLEDWISHQALEFTILTAKRSGEVRNADWLEFDLEARVWTIPAARMKSGREFREPLTDQAVALLEKVAKLYGRKGFVFPGAREGRPISDATMLEALKTLRPGLTVHGFRSSFRDWVAERASMPDARELAEAALAHKLKDKVEAAYQRGDLFEKRRLLMQAWADYVSGVES